MVYFEISGLRGCLNFVHAVHAAIHLSKHLPAFYVHYKHFEDDKWKQFVRKINNTYKWNCSTSPIIWKKFHLSGDKNLILIGGLPEFLEYCADYYNFQSNIPRPKLELLSACFWLAKKDNLPIFKIAIICDLESMYLQVINDLVDKFKFDSSRRYVFTIFNETWDILQYARILSDIVVDLANILPGVYSCVVMAYTIEDLLTDAAYVMITSDYSIKPDEDTYSYLKRCYLDMQLLIVQMNKYCPQTARVILSHSGCPCFNATVLLKYSTTIPPEHFVAVTSHEGTSMLNIVSQECDIPVSAIGNPMVWGAPGLVSYVDLRNTVCRLDVYKPFSNAADHKSDQKLTKGVVERELRLLDNHLLDENIVFEKKAKIRMEMKKQPKYGSIRACSSLFNIWVLGEPHKHIISLGVHSNGSFGIPCGMIVSQPAILNKEKLWEPFGEFPVNEESMAKIQDVVIEYQKYIKMIESEYDFPLNIFR